LTHEPLDSELRTTLQRATKDTPTHKRRTQNVEWIRNLSLVGLRHEHFEVQIPMVETSTHEKIVIQYPGKESERENAPNLWDFRPKLISKEESDLTFEQIWDPLFDDLRSIPQDSTRRRIKSILATLYYRIAYMVDYVERPAGPHQITRLNLEERAEKRESVEFGPFWVYRPPVAAVREVSAVISDWAGMSFEAFLHYNSLLAWNEDLKIRARFDKPPETQTGAKPQKWSARDPRGRINTLLTYIRVLGFITDEVRPSALLGGFARQRGMSTASNDEVIRICEPFVKKAEAAEQGTLDRGNAK
jgi:hypothetical protein